MLSSALIGSVYIIKVISQTKMVKEVEKIRFLGLPNVYLFCVRCRVKKRKKIKDTKNKCLPMLWTMQGKVIFSPSALITGQNEDQSGVQEQYQEENEDEDEEEEENVEEHRVIGRVLVDCKVNNL